MKLATNGLTGHRLAYALALALHRLDKPIEILGRMRPDVWVAHGKVHVTRVGAPDGFDYFSPDTDNDLVIDLITRYRAQVRPFLNPTQGFTSWVCGRSGLRMVDVGAPGETVGLAVTRAVIQFEIGPEVDIPEWIAA